MFKRKSQVFRKVYTNFVSINYFVFQKDKLRLIRAKNCKRSFPTEKQIQISWLKEPLKKKGKLFCFQNKINAQLCAESAHSYRTSQRFRVQIFSSGYKRSNRPSNQKSILMSSHKLLYRHKRKKKEDSGRWLNAEGIELWGKEKNKAWILFTCLALYCQSIHL